ncbi:MAG: hypothetical protein KA746_01140 [Pyrinomonadaceae bacterium]|nr:hypothetical protein [Pyrinomonadaceae bacterium]MBP6213968.1 hypothetical protein [Pyrinomonadaceae bacterium]
MNSTITQTPERTTLTPRPVLLRIRNIAIRAIFTAIGTLLIFYFSLVLTSRQLEPKDQQAVDRAIALLGERGFAGDAAVLRNFATFRSSDNWLNRAFTTENAFAATNFPFGVVTLYPDFFERADDDLERAMILLHEARHLQGRDERSAYTYVWNGRNQLGWTQQAYGTTPAYISIELQTRETVPELFSCSANLWHDCTEGLRAKR